MTMLAKDIQVQFSKNEFCMNIYLYIHNVILNIHRSIDIHFYISIKQGRPHENPLKCINIHMDI